MCVNGSVFVRMCICVHLCVHMYVNVYVCACGCGLGYVCVYGGQEVHTEAIPERVRRNPSVDDRDHTLTLSPRGLTVTHLI